MISESPARSTRLAAAELQTYVAEISGARLPIRAEAEDGTLFIIYDHQRYTLNRAGKRGVGDVMMAAFREADIRAARAVTDQSRLRGVITPLLNFRTRTIHREHRRNEDPTDDCSCRTELPRKVT